MDELQLDASAIVYPGERRAALAEGVALVPVAALAELTSGSGLVGLLTA